MSGLTGAVGLGVGASHVVAATSAGTAKAWGENKQGQLGDGSTTSRKSPVAVTGLTGLMPVDA